MSQAAKQGPQGREAQAARPAGRRLPIGAEVVGDGQGKAAAPAGVHFRLWAPKRKRVEVVFEDDAAPVLRLESEAGGYFTGLSPEARAGMRYCFRLDGGERLFPDPASRYQPDGPHGPSQVVDPAAFRWTDADWPGIGPAGHVLYEMHIGTFTPEGTWAAAERELPRLKELGITCLEVMPVAEFPGRFGWGYDGVDLFAPTRLYGAPDDFRHFVNRAHELGLGVILDVVYNHLGPSGNYLTEFADDYFTDKHKNDWGRSLNFDDANSHGVREFYIANARYWIEEFHLDGFRFDATDAIVDDSPEHILAAVCREARRAAGMVGQSSTPRRIYLINENEAQHTNLVRPPEQGGYGMDALWNDDFHHSALVVISGNNEAYLTDFLGRPQEFISAAKWGYLYQGQYFRWQKKRRGTPALDLPPTAFVHFIENHDQLANLARGLRTHHLTSLGHYKAMVALLLLMPQTPMLFQGQEFAASSPFQYFADHEPDLAKLVSQGRAKFLGQFPSAARPEMQATLPDPSDERTFQRCKLDHGQRTQPFHAEMYAMYADLLRLRHQEPVFRRVNRRGDVEGAVLGHDSFVLRYFGEKNDDRMLAVNFGIDRHLAVAPEPLLAPPAGRRWEVLWSSEDPRYLGNGTLPLENETESWRMPGRSAVVLRPVPAGSNSEGLVEQRPAASDGGSS